MEISVQKEFDSLMSRPGVLGALILSATGAVILSSFDSEKTIERATAVYDLISSSDKVKDLSKTKPDVIKFIRVKTELYELLICPSNDYIFATFANNTKDSKNF
ncbi:Dynein light chain roadblock-type 2 [Smittium mucronatum]|uniref:Dynein light chain roadblock-type 2 n=1 Tax=Smittium mucronatum TaxID=133383 RepID=A0A1R0GWJ8_9FUNG|nr:Dynein light chain roadblock-type 2 [Smittium mucronatum]